jgi:hypothetical protein
MIACSHSGERPIAYDLGVERSPGVAGPHELVADEHVVDSFSMEIQVCGELVVAPILGELKAAVTSDGGVDGLHLNQSVQSIAPTGGVGAITTFLYLLHANHVGCKPVEPCNNFVSPLGPPGLE